MNRTIILSAFAAALAGTPISAVAQQPMRPPLSVMLREGAAVFKLPPEVRLFADTASLRVTAAALNADLPSANDLAVAFGRPVGAREDAVRNAENALFLRFDSVTVSQTGIDLFVTRSGSYRLRGSTKTYHGTATYALRYTGPDNNWAFKHGLIVVIE